MRTRVAFTAAALLAASVGGADTDVRGSGDKVEVHATAAPLTEVLDRVARQTGMKVAYDGPQPRARVSLNLPPVTPTQAVLSILEGQGLNFALRMDPTGTRIETLLLVAGSGTAAAAAAPPLPARPEMGPRMFEREAEPPEPDEVPSEAPVRGGNEADDARGLRDVMPPMLPPSTGPAVPLMLPTPAAPGAVPGMMPGMRPGGMPGAMPVPGLPPGLAPSPAPATPQD
jgi:hypothetical protein